MMRAVAEGGVLAAAPMREAALAEGALLSHLLLATTQPVSPPPPLGSVPIDLCPLICAHWFPNNCFVPLPLTSAHWSLDKSLPTCSCIPLYKPVFKYASKHISIQVKMFVAGQQSSVTISTAQTIHSVSSATCGHFEIAEIFITVYVTQDVLPVCTKDKTNFHCSVHMHDDV